MSCSHGMVGFCPDCPPPAHEVGTLCGARAAWVLPKRAEGVWVEVRRANEDGSMGWCTWHFTRRGARRAAALFERTGRTRGFRP